MTKKQIEITLFIFSTILFTVGIYLSISIESHQKTIYWIAAVLATVGAVGPSAVDKLSFDSDLRVKPCCYTPEKRLDLLASVGENPTENDNEVFRKLLTEAQGRSAAERSPEDYLVLSTRALRGGSLEEALRYAYWGLYKEDGDIKVKAALAYGLGSVFVEVGNDPLAEEKFHRAIELDPAFSLPHGSLGLLYEKVGRNDDAKKAYKEALRLGPGVESHKTNLSLFYKKTEKKEVSNEERQVSSTLAAGDDGAQLDPGIRAQVKGAPRPMDEVEGSVSGVVHELGWPPADEGQVSVREKMTKETGEVNSPADATYGALSDDLKEMIEALQGDNNEEGNGDEEAGVTDDDLTDAQGKLLEVNSDHKGDVAAGVQADAKEVLDKTLFEAEKGGHQEVAGENTAEVPQGEDGKVKESSETPEYMFQKTARKEPRDCIEQYNLGLLYQRMGKLEEAEKAYREALILDPAYVKTHNNLGLLYQRTGRDEEAQTSYREALRLDPAFSWAYSNLGSLYKKMGKYDEAEKAYREALRLDPCDAIAEYNLGLLYQALGKNDEAEKAYTEALRLEPGYVKAHFNLGNLYKKMGKKEEAEKAYRKALRLEPGDASAQYNLGLLYHSMGRCDDAEEAYMAALTINPEYIKSHNNLGILYEKMKRQGDAEMSYKRAIALDPNYAKAKNNLALLRKKMSPPVAPRQAVEA